MTRTEKIENAVTTIRLATVEDSEAIRAIYAHYIDTSITFEEALPDEAAFRKRIASVLERYPCLVAECDGRVIGYAYAHEQAERVAYRWNVELSIYLDPHSGRKGLGAILYRALLDLLKAQGYRKAYARVTLPNAASKRLHAKLGFKLEWTQKRAGWKANRWHDVAWYGKQLLPQPECGDDAPAEPLFLPLSTHEERPPKPDAPAVDPAWVAHPEAAGTTKGSLEAAERPTRPEMGSVEETVVASVLGGANKKLAKLAKKPHVSATTRKCMQGNTATNTKPEQVVRKMLRDLGLPGYRLQWKQCPGKPDIAYPGRKVAIFVNGCFWHRCPICNLPAPKSNVEFWEAKFARNVERDRRNQEAAEAEGWTVVTIWEHDLTPERRDETSRYLYEVVKL